MQRIRPVLLSIAAAWALLVLPSSAQTSKSEFGIREEEPRTGSMIKRYIVYGSALPVNKRYHEFTPEEKALLNQFYEKIEPGDEPPFPVDGLRPILEAVQKAQAKLLVQGDLILLVEVAANGEPTQVKAIGAPSPEMVNFAASLLLVTKFKPAICSGQPCKMEFPFRYNFRVE